MSLLRPTRGSCVPAFVAGLLTLCAGSPETASAASPTKLALTRQRIELPGVPVLTLSVDLDRDGRRDLAVVTASTSWGEVGFEEPMQAGEDGTFVDVLTVVPTVLDRRELLVYLGAASGAGFAAEPLRFELPPTVHAVAAGPPAAPLVAWTDDGVAELVLAASTGEETGSTSGTALALVPRIAARTIFAGSDSFVSRSGLIADLDGDRALDLFVPVATGLAVHLATPAGLTVEATSLVPPPPADGPGAAPGNPSAANVRDEDDEHEAPDRLRAGATRDVLLPEVLDLNGDRLPDLLYRTASREGGPRVRLNLGAGRFGPAFDPLPGREAAAEVAAADVVAGSSGEQATTESHGTDIAWLGDLDGDGAAEVVTSEEISSGKDSMRAELAEAKRPHIRVRVHAIGPDGRWNPVPKAAFEVDGYVFEGSDDDSDEGIGFALPAGVRDLDGDGKLDLVALTLDFSLFEAMRVLATKSIQLGLDFGIYRQGDGLSFRPVPGLDLAGELRLRLDSLSLGQLSSFAGDFDGDGRADFLQLGRGRKVTIHRGQPGARYAPEPDLAIVLEREPLDAALVAVNDFDGDGRSDVCVTQPIGGKELGARAALDLYLSGGAR